MVEIHYFGHSFFKVSFPNRNVLIDPYIESKCSNPEFKRLVDCCVTEKDLKDISLILITHEHFDHFDKKRVEEIALKNNALVVAHDSILKELRVQKNLLHSVSLGQKLVLRNISVEAVPAHHPQSFYPLGFVLSFDKQSVYHAGDTDLINNFNNLKPDVALLPIGGTYTMDIVDAVRAVKTMRPTFVVPMHYNTFKMICVDVNEFKQKIDKSILKTKPVILKPGQKTKL